MALGGICALLRGGREPAGASELALVEAMAAGVPWRSAGGIAHERAGSAVLCSVVPKGAGRPPRLGLAGRGSLRVVADARLVRHPELVAQLDPERSGAREVTDAELILAAYRRWGDDCADHLLGDFAFAVWDGDRHCLLCARDPVGARALCYASRRPGDVFRVASSPLQLLAPADLPGDLDGTALLDLLNGFFHDSERTPFAAVRSLRPGCCLRFGEAGLETWRYWCPDRVEPGAAQPRGVSEAEWTATMRDLFLTVVGDHLGDAGPRAALMTSGGIDSSSIAAAAVALHERGVLATEPLGVVDVFERLRACDEWHYASALVEECGLAVERIRADDASDLVPDPSWREPAESPVAFSGELVAQVLDRVRERGCSVVTTGFGGDSLFDAARWQPYDLVRRGRWLRALPWVAGARRRGASWPRAAASVFLPPLLSTGGRRRLDRLRGADRYWRPPPWLRPELRGVAERRHVSVTWPRRFSSFARQRQYEHLVGLAQQGPAIELWGVHGARRGIEARFPLLDRRLAELVLRAPLGVAARPGPGGSKWLLRQAMAGILPERIRRRTDKGSWAALTRDTVCRRLPAEMRHLFAGSRLAEAGLVDDAAVLASLDRYCEGSEAASRTHGLLLGFAYLLERWLRSPGIEGRAIRYPSEQTEQTDRPTVV